MHEFPNGERHLIAYASRTLNEHEKCYRQIDKEALAIMFGLKRFHLYLYGRHFTIISLWIISLWREFLVLKQPFPCLLAAMRLQRWLIIQLSTTASSSFRQRKMQWLRAVKTSLAVNAQWRRFCIQCWRAADPLLTHYAQGNKPCTRVDAVLSKVLEYVTHSWPRQVEDLHLQPYSNRRSELSVLSKTVFCKDVRWLYLFGTRKTCYKNCTQATQGLYEWRSWDVVAYGGLTSTKKLKKTVRDCKSCQQVKKPPTVAPLTPWLWPSDQWHRICIDYAEDETGHYFILVDARSCWPEI